MSNRDPYSDSMRRHDTVFAPGHQHQIQSDQSDRSSASSGKRAIPELLTELGVCRGQRA